MTGLPPLLRARREARGLGQIEQKEGMFSWIVKLLSRGYKRIPSLNKATGEIEGSDLLNQAGVEFENYWEGRNQFLSLPDPRNREVSPHFLKVLKLLAEEDFAEEEGGIYPEPKLDWSNLIEARTLPKYEEVKALQDYDLTPNGNSERIEKWHSAIWNEENPVYEIWTEEYIDELAKYLQSRKILTSGEPLRVLEVGAGDGRLTYLLNNRLEELGIFDCEVTAVDDGSLNITRKHPVDQMDYREGLGKYQPHIVISSWMPYGTDFTEEFRKTDSVQEYILIGEAWGGCCGDPDKTWGYVKEKGFIPKGTLSAGVTPFTAQDLKQVEQYQISRMDWIHGKSSTISFRREREKE